MVLNHLEPQKHYNANPEERNSVDVRTHPRNSSELLLKLVRHYSQTDSLLILGTLYSKLT